MLSLLFAAALLGRGALAQTWTACNPLNTTCPNDPALGTSHNFVFNTSSSVTDTFNITAGSLNYGANGAEFTINQKGDSPTIESQFYFFFGSVSVVMQAATGQGVISSIVLESDDLDEVDWEFMGGNSTHAETNYFGKGNTTAYDRAIYYPVSSDPRKNMHNYTVNWTSERLEWYIDSQLVRTLPYAAANGGDNYPQTPMTLRLGIWAGGDPGNSKGTIEWAGGEIDYNKGPYTMYVQSAQVNDYSTGSAYEYSDHSGSWQSIKSIAGNSTAVKAIAKENEPAPPTAAQKFQALSTGTKVAIYAGAGAGAAVLFAAFLFFFIKQRRAGRLERDAYNKLVEQQREEAFKDQQALREKGLGGFDANSTKGEDALGGWSGNEAAAEEPPPMPKMPMNVVANEIPRSGSPAIPRVASPALSRVGSPAPGIKRLQSPPPVSPVPQHPTVPAWAANGNGNANNGGLINNAGNAYSGGYGGNPNPAPSRTPSFPFPAQGSPQPRPSPGGYNQGGYSQGGYNQGGYNQGGYNQGGYNQGGYQRY